MKEPKVVPDKYKDLQKSWKRREIIWSLTHYALGITAAVLAFLASSKDLQKFVEVDNVSALAIASGIVAAILTILSPASRRKAYTEACNLLRVARLRFEHEEKTYNDLNNAVETAQDIIAKR